MKLGITIQVIRQLFIMMPAFCTCYEDRSRRWSLISCPSKLDFGQIKATGLIQEAFGQMDGQEKLWIYDQQETKSPWILTIKLSQPFTNDAGFSMQDVLYFKKAEEYQLVNEEELEIVRGQNSTNVQADYSEYLNNGRAFKLVLTKENQIAGNYSAEITWTLADAPTE